MVEFIVSSCGRQVIDSKHGVMQCARWHENTTLSHNRITIKQTWDEIMTAHRLWRELSKSEAVLVFSAKMNGSKWQLLNLAKSMVTSLTMLRVVNLLRGTNFAFRNLFSPLVAKRKSYRFVPEMFNTQKAFRCI